MAAVAAAPLSVQISARCLQMSVIFMFTVYDSLSKMSTISYEISAGFFGHCELSILVSFSDAGHEAVPISALT